MYAITVFILAVVCGITAADRSCRVTTKDILGPYYKRNAPVVSFDSRNIPQICANTPAQDRLFLNGTIRVQKSASDCGVGTRAFLDIWQANSDGVYSSTSMQSKDYTCRIRFFTDDNGFFSLTSIFPGRYDDGGYRPAHIHFMITPVDRNNQPTGTTLTTQLYFAEDFYLSPRDSCQICGSGQPSQIAHVEHIGDIKSFTGSWDILLSN
ncbi:uncharacterized protein LOC129592588 [Paramacrobiotus metropolitanus]|uniref:uncharacterized protein LOC129592588 n=1 Tax=Paramacrobiotus metropolitanus TaxID=2943436 RepID=UPI002445A7F4|nr:uncharacterized protein LOC129592588 [Paramacrobiotus metropolitanus]